jgi:glycosyltransferase involved in cell wall biosynthesis
VSCPRTRRNINLSSYYFDNSSNEAELQDVLVSESQKAKLHTIQFPYPEGFIIEQNRPTDQLEMISKNKRNKGPLLVGFVGVIAGNNDNKGLEISVRICRELKSPKVMFLGVACSKDLQVDISFSRLANKDLQNVFDLLDVLIVPSKLETFSMVSYEAVSTGCQVICRGGLAPTTWGSPLIASPEIASDEGLFEFVKGKILNA